jgi:hypothetical protein
MSRRRVLLALKSVLAVVIIAAVGWQFAKLLRSPELWERDFAVRAEYLVPAGLLYLAAHTIWGTFFFQLLRSQGAEVSWLTGVRTYFVSQFGKYVPGKALVIVLRVVMLRRHGVSAAVVAVTATYETLTNMAAGAVVGVALLPWAGLGPEVDDELGFGAWIGLVAVGGLPLTLGVLNKVTARIADKRRGPDARPLPSPPVWLLLQGLLQAAVGWCLLGLSLWMTLQGLFPDDVGLTRDRYLESTAAVAVSYVAGFVAIVLPGGLGAREWVLLKVLPRQVPAGAGPPDALAAVAALVLRLVWTVFEVGCAVMLWWFARPGPAKSPDPVPEAVGHG